MLNKNLNRHMTYHYEKYYNRILTISNELTSFYYVFTQTILDIKDIQIYIHSVLKIGIKKMDFEEGRTDWCMNGWIEGLMGVDR